jgi:hypothetical protein
MKIKGIVSVVGCVIVLQAVVCSAGQDANAPAGKVDLKLRLKVGESHEMKMTQTQNMTQTMNGQETKTKQTQEMVMDLNVLSVDANGVMDIEMTCKSMKMAMDGPMGHMEFDSSNPKPVDHDESGQQMLATAFSFIRGGAISAFNDRFTTGGLYPGASFIVGGFLSVINDNMNRRAAEIKDKTFAGTLSTITDSKIQMKITPTGEASMTSFAMGTFPAEPVAVGDTWHSTTSTNSTMPMDISTTCSLKDRKDGIAYVDTVTNFNMGDGSKVIADPNNKVSVQMSGTMNSTNEVDEKTGLARKSNIVMNFSSITRMEASKQIPQSMTMPMTIQGNIIIELVK